MLDVKFYEAFQEEQEALKAHLPENISADFTGKTIQEEGDTEVPAKAICIRTQSRIPPDWANKIEGILTRSQGFDHLLAYRKETGINLPCGCLENYCSRAVAEQAILSMMALLRKLKKQIKQFDSFDRDELTGVEILGKKALIVGVGKIGSEIVDIAQGLRMNVKGVDIAPQKKNVEYVSLEEGIKWADVIFSAVPLTEATQGLLGYETFLNAKRGATFVNISRGETSPVKDLEKLLEKEILGSVSLDVFENEKDLADVLRKKDKKQSETVKILLRLKEKNNVLFTPHNAFNTNESVEKKSKQTIDSLVNFFNKKEFLSIVA